MLSFFVALEKLRAGGVGGPLLVLLGRPAALTHQPMPHVRMVDRPQDVRGSLDAQAALQRLAGPLATILATLPESAAAELRERALSRIAVYENGAGLNIPGVSLVASARA